MRTDDDFDGWDVEYNHGTFWDLYIAAAAAAAATAADVMMILYYY